MPTKLRVADKCVWISPTPVIYIIYIYLSGFDKRYLQKFQVRFNNLTLEVNKKQLKVAS